MTDTAPLRIAIVNQEDEGGATAAAKELLAWGPERGFAVRYFPGEDRGDPAALFEALEGFAPHLVHAHCWYQSYPYELLATLGERWPAVLTVHDAYVVNQYGIECWECYRNAWCLGCPALEPLRRWRPNYRILSRIRKRRINRATKAHLILPSEWMKRRLARSELRHLPSEVIPYGIDVAHFSPGDAERARFGLPAGPVILFAGNMYDPRDHRKGLPDLLEAFVSLRRRMTGVTLALAGAVALPSLPEGAVRLGEIPREALPALYRSADLFCLPTRGDNLPVAVLEAMACGLPVVATTVGGLPEEVGEGENGRLVPPGRPEALSEALGALLADDAKRTRYAKTSRERAVATFSRERAAAAHDRLYRELVRRG